MKFDDEKLYAAKKEKSNYLSSEKLRREFSVSSPSSPSAVIIVVMARIICFQCNLSVSTIFVCLNHI